MHTSLKCENSFQDCQVYFRYREGERFLLLFFTIQFQTEFGPDLWFVVMTSCSNLALRNSVAITCIDVFTV